jgi:membrane-associated phospholipid phosphatase
MLGTSVSAEVPNRELGSRLKLTMPEPAPLAVNLDVDLQVLVTGLLTTLAPNNPNFTLAAPVPRSSGALDRSEVNALDRTVIGNDAGWASSLSDVTLYGAMSLPYAALLIDAAGRGGDWAGLGADALVLTKTYAVNALVCGLVKQMARRPRPYMYDPNASDEQREANNSHRSFFSGHTSISFSLATSYSYLFTLRHPDSPYLLPVWLGSHALAGTTAVMRVLAGKHFWSDVMVGALVGSAIGLAVPWLHRQAASPHATSMERFLAELRLVPTFYEQGGVGANALWYW